MLIEVVRGDGAHGQTPSRRVIPGRGALVAAWRDPLLRNGHFLTLSSGATAVIGLVYWTLAAHRYSTAVVGRSSAVIAAVMVIGGVGQLNLSSALVRFVPVAGDRTRRLVVTSYLAAATLAGLLALGFLAVAPAMSTQFRFVTGTPAVASGFVLAATAWTVFVLQDSVLVGLRLPELVATENAAFSVAKVATVVGLAAWLPRYGVLVSWSAGLAVSLVGTNLYLFRRALPRQRLGPGSVPTVVSARTVARFTGPDCIGALCWLGATTAMPFLVIADVGATGTAYFAIAWQFGLALFTLSANMGFSLVVETAADQSQLADRWRSVIRHMMLPLGGAVAVIVLAAPDILRVFGAAYAEHAVGLLRLLALAAIPNLVTATAASAARAQQRTVSAATIMTAISVGVVALSAGLLPAMGLAGVGMAWLVIQSAVAVVLLIHPAWWLQDRRSEMYANLEGPARPAAVSKRDPLLLGVTVGLLVVATITLAGGFAARELRSVYISVACSALAAVGLVSLSRLHRIPPRAEPATRVGPVAHLAPSPSPPNGRSANGSAGGDMNIERTLPIEHYDRLRVAEILPLLQVLDAPGLEDVRAHEAHRRSRNSILSRIALLLEPDAATRPDPVFPIEGYDGLRVDEIVPLLARLDRDQLTAVAAREQSGSGRTTVLKRVATLLGRADQDPRHAVAAGQARADSKARVRLTSPARPALALAAAAKRGGRLAAPVTAAGVTTAPLTAAAVTASPVTTNGGRLAAPVTAAAVTTNGGQSAAPVTAAAARTALPVPAKGRRSAAPVAASPRPAKRGGRPAAPGPAAARARRAAVATPAPEGSTRANGRVSRTASGGSTEAAGHGAAAD